VTYASVLRGLQAKLHQSHCYLHAVAVVLNPAFSRADGPALLTTAHCCMSVAGLRPFGSAQSHWQQLQPLTGFRCITASCNAGQTGRPTRRVAAHAVLQPQGTANKLDAAAAAAAPAPSAAYVHLPFCKRKCFYCDFPVEAVGLNVNKTSEWNNKQQQLIWGA